MENSDNVILEFGHTPSSPNYGRAVQIAKSMSSYKHEGQDSQIHHQVALIESESDKWFQIYKIVQNWKSARVTRGDYGESAKYNESLFRCYMLSTITQKLTGYTGEYDSTHPGKRTYQGRIGTTAEPV